MNQIKKLIFIYNADSDIFSQVSDFAHKLISPDTYECNLCKLTYGNVAMKDEWKVYLNKLPYQKEFLHKDEFSKQYPNLAKTVLPAIFLKSENQMELLLSAQEINSAKTLTDLKLKLMDKLTGLINRPNIN